MLVAIDAELDNDNSSSSKSEDSLEEPKIETIVCKSARIQENV